MSILDRALDEIESIQHYDGGPHSVYCYEANRIVREVAGEYEVEVAKEKARADAYEAIIKNLRLGITITGREDEAPEPIEPTLIDLDERIKEKEEQ